MERLDGDFGQLEYDLLMNELFVLKAEERLEGKDNSKRIAEIKRLIEE